ncbi:MAG: tetratricopeptide repeat protein [Bauldia sp.]
MTPGQSIEKIRGLLGARRYADALAEAEAAAMRADSDPTLLTLQAFALLELGRNDEAMETIDRAIAAGAPTAEQMYLRFRALWQVDRTEPAIAALETATRLAPRDAHLRVILGRHRLALGDFARGWADYEQRARPTIRRDVRPWSGESLAGKHLLVVAEQGLGDTVQFCRYLPILAAMAAKVTAMVQPPLASLVASVDPSVAVTSDTKSPAPFDLRVDMLSVPFFLRTTADTIPAKVPYIGPAADKVAHWRAVIGERGPKIGIAWQGSAGRSRDDERSLPLAALTALAYRPEIRLISLQGMTGLDELAGVSVERLGPRIESNPDGIAEIAAAMQSVDLVVCSDTMTAHLAGALGVPVWVGLKADANWRWLRGQSDTPWYPTMRLFRQATAADWPPVIAAMLAALKERLA